MKREATKLRYLTAGFLFGETRSEPGGGPLGHRKNKTMPLEPDETGQLEYAGPQYIVCGTPEGFTETQIGSVRIEIAASHPSTGVEEPNFVIELYPIRLKWRAQHRKKTM